MAKNKKGMSFSIQPEMHEELTNYAIRKGLKTSVYLVDLITSALKLPVDDDPVVISLDPELHVKLDNYATKKDLSLSTVINQLIEKGNKITVDDGSAIPVVLKVPTSLKGEELVQWLNSQVTILADKLGSI